MAACVGDSPVLPLTGRFSPDVDIMWAFLWFVQREIVSLAARQKGPRHLPR
jgi:hypothetical protein